MFEHSSVEFCVMCLFIIIGENGHNFDFLIQVVFATPVSIAANPKINEWLTLTEKEMRVTLAKLLQEAVKDIAVFKSGQIDPNLYLQWIDKFQVSEDFF